MMFNARTIPSIKTAAFAAFLVAVSVVSAQAASRPRETHPPMLQTMQREMILEHGHDAGGSSIPNSLAVSGFDSTGYCGFSGVTVC